MTDTPHDGATSRFDPARVVALGRTDVPVTQMAIGTVPIGGLFDGVSYDEARAVLETGWESGVRFFDVAPLYGYGSAERVVGDVLRDKPRAVVLARHEGRSTSPRDRSARSRGHHGALPG